MAERNTGPGRFVVFHTNRDGTVSCRPALGRRTRLRLAAIRRVDTVCDWLCWHHLDAAAILIWRTLGLWPSSTKAVNHG